ncbi:MAG: isoprenylcysteine carboxylmethyltransferase family protein [Bacteroidota bacterium]
MKKIIPPYLFLFCVSFMNMMTIFSKSTQLSTNYFLLLIGISLTVGSLALAREVGKHFAKVQTEIHTFKSPKKLVTSNFFQYSRNPIYLGFLTALTGVMFITGNLASFVGVFLFFFVAHFFYIPFEEQQLTHEFGNQYVQYKKQVRRWL